MVVTVVHNFLIITFVIPVRDGYGSKSYCLRYRIMTKLDSIYELSDCNSNAYLM